MEPSARGNRDSRCCQTEKAAYYVDNQKGVILIDLLFIDSPTFKRAIPKQYQRIISAKLTLGSLRENRVLACPNDAPSNFYSPGVLSMAGVLENANFRVGYFSWSSGTVAKLRGLLAETQTIAVTAYTATINEAVELCDFVKSVKPSIRTILGGHHATALDVASMAQSTSIDIVIRGEGEYALLDLLQKPNHLSSVDGITYRDTLGNIRRNRNREDMVEVRKLPMPAYHLLGDNIGQYIHNISSSRGCPYSCHYCAEGSFFRGIRRKTPSQVVGELSYLNSRLPPGAQVFINDSTYLIDSKWTTELCRRIRQTDINLSISCNMRPETVTPEIIQEMQRSRFSRVCVGFEDGNDEIRRTAGKRCSFDALCKACKVIRTNSDLIIIAYWMTGLPGSSLSSVRENIQKTDLLIQENLVDDIHNKVFVPYPGTQIGNTPELFGLDILTTDWSKYDRLSLPVYRLRKMSQQQIYRAFWRMERGLIASLMKREGLCRQDITYIASKPVFRYVMDNYIQKQD